MARFGECVAAESCYSIIGYVHLRKKNGTREKQNYTRETKLQREIKRIFVYRHVTCVFHCNMKAVLAFAVVALVASLLAFGMVVNDIFHEPSYDESPAAAEHVTGDSSTAAWSLAKVTDSILRTTSLAEMTDRILGTTSLTEMTDRILGTTSLAEMTADVVKNLSAAEVTSQIVKNVSVAEIQFALLAAVQMLETQKIVKPKPQFSACKYFYLDVGSNIGVQIRKLYEPRRYPAAPVLDIFDSEFGEDRRKVCAIGIEMNPSHSRRLQALEEHYTRKCGYTVKIFRETAAATHDGFVDFYTDMDRENLEWGASTVYNWNVSTAGPQKVRAMDIARFLVQEVLPFAKKVVMKMDIEGAEASVLPRLIALGALCSIDVLFIEQHVQFLDKLQTDVLGSTMRLFPRFFSAALCKAKIVNLDDETFLHDADSTMNTC